MAVSGAGDGDVERGSDVSADGERAVAAAAATPKRSRSRSVVSAKDGRAAHVSARTEATARLLRATIMVTSVRWARGQDGYDERLLKADGGAPPFFVHAS